MKEGNRLLGDVIKNTKKLFNVFVPAVASKENVMTFLSKGLSNIFPNIFLVTWELDEREDRICYQNLIKTVSENKNSLFILDDISTFILYSGNVFGYPLNNNFFILLMDNIDNKKNTSIIINKYSNRILWPAPCDLDLSIEINERCVYMTGKQEKIYSKSILEFQKSNRDIESNMNGNNTKESEGFLNVYLENENSLASLDIEEALKRSLKFKNIIISILLWKKKRHVIRMVDGRYGIDSFSSLYNRIDDKIENSRLIIIKNTDPSSSKITKINMFNESNKPMILLTDCLLTKNLTPKNIDYYHLTNGGSYEDVIMLFYFSLGTNYSGIYKRTINVNCYISQTIKNDIMTLDQYNFNYFNETMKYINKRKSLFKGSAGKIFYIGEDLYVSIDNK